MNWLYLWLTCGVLACLLDWVFAYVIWREVMFRAEDLKFVFGMFLTGPIGLIYQVVDIVRTWRAIH